MNKPMRMCKAPGCMKLTAEGWCPDHKPKHQRGESAAWHHLYTNPRFGWKHRREAHLAREPFCRECGKRGLRVKATDVDHVIPHRGDVEKFCKGELQSLCKGCHSRKTMRENGDLYYDPARRSR